MGQYRRLRHQPANQTTRALMHVDGPFNDRLYSPVYALGLTHVNLELHNHLLALRARKRSVLPLLKLEGTPRLYPTLRLRVLDRSISHFFFRNMDTSNIITITV